MNKWLKWELWFRGLMAAGIGSAANGVTLCIVDPSNFNIHEGMKKLGEVCLGSALVSMAMYLKQSPLPPPSTGNRQLFVNPNPVPKPLVQINKP